MPPVTDPKPAIVIRPSVEDLRDSRSILVAGNIAFFIQAWRMDPAHPANGYVTGSMYLYPELDARLKSRGVPQCILGTDPERPARALVMLNACPDGPVTSWTSTQLLNADLFLTFPKSPPWLKDPLTVHFSHTNQITDVTATNDADPTNANPPVRP
jgi:hypothetical protein